MPLVPDADHARHRGLTHHIQRVSDSALDVALVAFALWTVIFHVALALDWRRDFTALVWLAILTLTVEVWLLFRSRRSRQGSRPGADHRTTNRRSPRAPAGLVGGAVGLSAATAVYAAVVEPTGAAWWPVWVGVVATTAVGVVVALRFRPRLGVGTREEPREARWPTLTVVTLAFLMAALSVMTLRPEGDDVYVMNQALYVEAHDEPFPERDTIFADQVFRDTRPHDLPASAIEPLIGIAGRWLPFSTPTVAYLLLAPAISFLGVFAVWRLARTLRTSWPALATAGTLAFLFLDGAENPSFGNMSLTRSWQGKAIVVFLLLPLVWHYALAWARDGDRRAMIGLMAALVAGVGLSTTGLAVVPAAAALGLVAGVVVSRRPARLWTASTAFVYPLLTWLIARQAERPAPIVGQSTAAPPSANGAAGATAPATATVPPPDAPAPAPFEFSGDLQGLDADTLWYFVFGHEVTSLLVSVIAMALTWVVLHDRASRLAVALGSFAVFALVYAPGAAARIDDATHVGAVLWRSVWIVPLPLMVGLLLAAPASLRSARDRLAGAAASVGVLVALFATGTPVIDGARVSNFGKPAWDVEPVTRAAAAKLTDLAEPGAIAAAPERVGWALSSTTIKVRPVNPRGFELVGSHAVAEFRSDDRRLLSEATERGLEPGEADRFGTALDALRVSIACVDTDVTDPRLEQVFERHGFEVVERHQTCTYWRRG